MNTARLLRSALVLATLLAPFSARAAEPPYRPGDEGIHPAGATRVLPDSFLRGFDPVTVFFAGDQVPAAGPADDGAGKLKLSPAWPGAWSWVDRRTLQFRPAEAWPPLARFQVEAAGERRILTTLLAAPTEVVPSPGSERLAPFRQVVLTFAQPIGLETLKKMVQVELRDAPGIGGTGRSPGPWTVTTLPRATARDPQRYALTFEREIPEGTVLRLALSLGLGESSEAGWSTRLTTRPAFHLEAVRCGAAQLSIAGVKSPKEGALACGNQGEVPELQFSDRVGEVSPTLLARLVALEPSVPDLHAEVMGERVRLRGSFVPDTLYRLRLSAAPLTDGSGRMLRDPGGAELFFHLGWRSPFLRWNQSTALLEAKGPRMLPIVGLGEGKADVRIHAIDPLHNGLWPFSPTALAINEDAPPPFPGEEPAVPSEPTNELDPESLQRHLRLLGTPLVSTMVTLPLAERGGARRAGLDLAPLLEQAVGKDPTGTYLVGLRRPSGPPERTWMRVQVTDLALSTVSTADRLMFWVTSISTGQPVEGVTVRLQGTDIDEMGAVRPAKVELRTNAQGRVDLMALPRWQSVTRLALLRGRDVLVLDPREPPPSFVNAHWSYGSDWLGWLMQKPAEPPPAPSLGFVFTERPIYRPGEQVFVKGWLRRKANGEFSLPRDLTGYRLEVVLPDGQRRPVPLKLSPLGGFDAAIETKDLPTGEWAMELTSTGEGQLARTGFKVEAYRVPTFEVRITGPKVARLDQPFSVKAFARYYAGGSVAGQPVKWVVTPRPWYRQPVGREGFLFASSEQFARAREGRMPGFVTREATLDEDGAATLKLDPSIDLDGSARIYRVEATVTGADDQPVSHVEEFKALPAFTLGMKLPRFLESATAIPVQLLAVGPDDKPVAGQAITVRVLARTWRNTLRETHLATGKAQYATEQRDENVFEKEVKSAADVLALDLPVKGNGVFVVELVARDALGRVQRLSADLFVGGKQALAWQKPREGLFQLVPDAKRYAPGQIAHVLIQSPFQRARALVVIEDQGGNQYRWLDVEGGKATLDVPLEGRHAPNLPIHVVLMRGRIEAGSTAPERGDDRYRPSTVASSIDLEIEPKRNVVDVKVAHPAQARPGQKVELTVTLADDQKKPLAGEVTLWLVDEAVLSLAREGSLDPVGAFVRRAPRTVAIHDTRNLLVGRLIEQDEEPGGDGDEGDGSDSTRIVRKNFQTVPYWAATLQVPASGKLVVPVTLSDDLTNFRVRAMAVSGMGRFGFSQSTLPVRLPVIVTPAVPRFVRQGDVFRPGALVRLVEGAEGPASVKVKLTGPAEAAKATATVALKKGAAEPVRTDATVRSDLGPAPAPLKVRVDVTRQSDGQGDAFEVSLPVLADQRPERAAWIDPGVAGDLPLHALPEPARPGTVERKVTLSAVSGLLELAAALDWLGQYPHGCLEQQLSQLYPELVQASMLAKLGFELPNEAARSSHVKRFLADLPAFQDDRGLFAFWPGQPGDPSLTAIAFEWMSEAQKAGFTPDAGAMGKAEAALARMLRSDASGLLPAFIHLQQTDALRALSRRGKVDEQFLIEAYQRRASFDATSLASLAEALAVRPQLFSAQLATVKDELWRSMVIELDRGVTKYGGFRRPMTWGEWLGSDASSLGTVLGTLSSLDPADGRLDVLRAGLVAMADPTRGWRTTYANRRAIAGLATWLERAKPNAPIASLQYAGAPALEVKGQTLVATRVVPPDAAAGKLTGAASGVRTQLTWIPAVASDAMAPRSQGLTVARRTTVLAPSAGGAVREDPGAAGSKLELSVGDVVEVHAGLTSPEARSQVALIVPFAAGFEPLNPELANAPAEARPSEQDTLRPSHVERLDHEVRYYFDRLPAGFASFHFRLRATHEGSFVQPSPWAEAMYRDEIRGRGAGQRVVITRK